MKKITDGISKIALDTAVRGIVYGISLTVATHFTKKGLKQADEKNKKNKTAKE